MSAPAVNGCGRSLSTPDLALLAKFVGPESPSISEQFTAAFFVNLAASGLTPAQFHAAFQQCTRNLERLRLCRKYFKWISDELRGWPYGELIKNAQISTALKEAGNKYFKAKAWKRGLRAYNLALCFAPPNSPELGIAYANRSAVHMEQRNRRLALADLELALANGYPAEMGRKLAERRAKIEKMVEEQSEDAEIEELRRPCAEFCRSNLFNTESEDGADAGSADRVQIENSVTYGRHLVAKDDVEPGTSLLVEEPYVAVLRDELQWNVDHCHHCLAQLRDGHGLPCEGCVFAFYCSSECRQETQAEYHRYECMCLPFLHLKRTPRHVLLAFRVLCKQMAVGSLSDVELEFPPLSGLISHADSEDPITAFSNTIQALVLVGCLEQYGHGRGNFDFEQLAIMALTLLQTIPYNSISLDEIHLQSRQPTREEIKGCTHSQYAAAIYLALSLINHSCAPNVTRVNDTRRGRMVIVAVQRIRKGEQLFTSYTQHFTANGCQERQRYLAENYHFTCDCAACSGRWPVLPELLARDDSVQFVCDRCPVPVALILIPLEGERVYICSKCKARNKQVSLESEFPQRMRAFFECYDAVLDNRPLEAVGNLTECLNYFQTRVQAPFARLYMTQDLVKRALDLIVYNARA